VETLTRDADATGDEQETAPRLSGVVLRFAGARYAVDMAAVAEVVPVPPVTRLPGGPSWLSGVVNWRGRVLPVLDLRPLVGAALAPLPTSARLVVLSVADVECGVVADLVPGLLECDADAVEPVPATASSAIGGLVLGVVDDDGPIAVLDAAAVLQLRDQLPHARRGTR
jgi:purine-binding chemotaxis protein CheW